MKIENGDLLLEIVRRHGVDDNRDRTDGARRLRNGKCVGRNIAFLFHVAAFLCIKCTHSDDIDGKRGRCIFTRRFYTKCKICKLRGYLL